MPEVGEFEVTAVNRNGLATRAGILPTVNHPLPTGSVISAHPSEAQARTIEPEAARGARFIGCK
jgi:hypothetical protein